MQQFLSRKMLTVECAMLVLALPTALYFIHSRGALFLTLWGLALIAVVIMRKEGAWQGKEIFRTVALRGKEMRMMLTRFAVIAGVMGLLTFMFEPERFLSMPRERPELWVKIMLFYPLLSVLPQEIIFRTFFFRRYAPLFPNAHGMVLVSGVAFGYAHLILQNWVGIISCTIGGLLFAHTYYKSRSLALVWLEHTLYGCFVFTIGLGWYFYSGAVR